MYCNAVRHDCLGQGALLVSTLRTAIRLVAQKGTREEAGIITDFVDSE